MGLAAGGLRLRRGPRRPLLSALRVHLAALEPPHGRVRRLAREPRPLPARDRRPRSASAAAPTIRSCTGSAGPRARRAASRSRTRPRSARCSRAPGVCAISVSAGNWYALHQTIGPMFLPRGFLVPLAATIKRAVERAGDRGRQARRRGPRREDPRRRRRRPDRDRPGAHRRSRLAAEGAGGEARRDPPLHRLQRLRRPRREREAGALRRQPRGRARGLVEHRAGTGAAPRDGDRQRAGGDGGRPDRPAPRPRRLDLGARPRAGRQARRRLAGAEQDDGARLQGLPGPDPARARRRGAHGRRGRRGHDSRRGTRRGARRHRAPSLSSPRSRASAAPT